MIIENGILNKIEEKDVINGTVTIPEGVTEIGSLLIDKEDSIRSTFDLGGLDDLNNQEDEEKRFPKNIKRIIIPKTVIKIDKMAFMGLESLENIEFEEGIQLTDIGANAFNGCSSLSGIKIPETVTTIDVDAFRGCSSISNLTFPKDSTVIISESSFEKCDNLKELHFLGSAQTCDDDKKARINIVAQNVKDMSSLNENTIGEVKRIIEYFTIPINVKIIESRAFTNYLNLKKVILPNGLQTIAEEGFRECMSLQYVNIPQSVKKIGEAAFMECYDLISINIPSNITIIPLMAFKDCNKLKSVNISEGVKIIAPYAFFDCGNLSKVIFPKTLEKIESRAFWRCDLLKRVDLFHNTKHYDYAFSTDCSIKKYLFHKGFGIKQKSTDDDGR